MSRVVVHVGTHKTATTTLQDTFFHNRALLERHSVVFPEIGKTHGQHGLVCAWNNLPEPYRIDDPDATWAMLRETWASTGKTLFLSSEEFSRASPRRVDMADLRARLDGFDEVRLVCTLRNQRSFLQSIYQQISRDRAPLPFARFFGQVRSTGQASGLWLNYLNLYNHFLTGFSPDEIVFVSYEAATAEPGGILGAYLDILDCGLLPSDLSPLESGDSNVSSNPLAVLVANIVAAPQKAPAWLVEAAALTLEHRFGANTPMTLFSPTEIRELHRMFSDGNRRLEKQRAPHQAGFSIGEILTGNGTIGRKKLTPDFWQAISRAVFQARHGTV
jgi:hypothetical protein